MIVSQLIANGLISGSIIALVAAGFSLIYATNRFAHFAHGAVVAAAGYIFFTSSTSLGLPLLVSIFLAILATSLIGVVLYTAVYRPLKKKKSSSVILLIASIGLMILIENMLLAIYGASVKSPDVLPLQVGMNVLGAVITPLQLWIIAIAVVLFLALLLFAKKSKIGKLMRAVADDPDLANISGINAVAIERWSFAIGSALAGLAGILIALEQNLIPSMGTNLIIKGFTGAVIGGVSSIPGAIIGSYILGLVENIGIWFLPSAYKEAIAFTLLLLFLILKPDGLFGVNKGTKA